MKRIKQQPIRPNWKLKALSATVLSILAVPASNASDLEIYKAAASGGAIIMMMLDTSGSMGAGSIAADYPAQDFYINSIGSGTYCNFYYNKMVTDKLTQSIYDNEGVKQASTNDITYSVNYCVSNKINYYDRISRLKMALIPMFANPKSAFGTQDISKIKIGLGNFFSTNLKTGGGVISYAASGLDLANRKKMLDIIKDMQANTNTPTAHAYAEAGSYMMGTTTKTDATNNYSGFGKANANAVNGTNYLSPIDTTSTCQGYGIYFLTDGAPNNTVGNSAAVVGNSAAVMMNKSMNNTIQIGNTETKACTSGLTGGEFVGSAQGEPGWECIGEYAKALRNPANPRETSVVTAAAGFGKDFKQLDTNGKVGDKYDCDATGLSQDAKNLCKLGEKGYDYGKGGFFYVETSDQLAASVVNFIAGVGNKEIPAVSTGTMSVPVDSLNTEQSRGFAYMPILDPKPGETNLWNGNLKKYYIRNSTITSDDAGTLNVFSDQNGNFAQNTQDMWNTIVDTNRKDTTKPDNGQPQVGGTYQKIFENTDINRNLWIDVNKTLTNVKVDNTTKKPTGFTALKPVLRPDLVKPTTGADPRTSVITSILNNIITFLGFPAQSSTTEIDDNTVLTGAFDKTQKNLGGVLHSLPQLVTYEVALDTNGKFTPSTRKDNVLYGSMDGALHLVDDTTGAEKFTFIPKEILELQANALNKGSTADSKLPQGVDAPWNVFTNYNFVQSTTPDSIDSTKNVPVTKYQAIQILAAGGLRMGGSSYYNLDITTDTTPKLVYSVGSNYAKYLQNIATSLKGMQNGVESTSNDQAAFARMGQSWGKPSIGYVMSGGKKVMVNFLPGGYDTCYENATFKLNTAGFSDTKCNSKTAAQGNAVYMVKVGEQTINSATNKPTITTGSDSGKLLWWATQGTSTDGKTTAAATLQASTNPDLVNSVVTEILPVDRDYDGLTDHIYFADLGGRVWRADISNNKATTNFKIDRVVKILDVSNQASGTDAPPRFYERPLLTVTNKVNGKPQGMITVGTGNRSQPVSEKRSTADALYTFMDPDVAKPNLFCYIYPKDGTVCTPSVTSTATALTVTDLAQLKFTADDKTIPPMMKAKANGLTTDDSGKAIVPKAGWYYPLTEWVEQTKDTTGTVTTTVTSTTGLKMFNEPDAQAGLLFTTIYNPNLNSSGASCSAGVQGVTQRSLMCLPFGNCASFKNPSTDADYTKRSVTKAGIGIVDNIITQSKPNVAGSLYGVLDTYCTGADCDKNLIKKTTCVVTATEDCKSFDITSGTGRDKLINPREWWEK